MRLAQRSSRVCSIAEHDGRPATVSVIIPAYRAAKFISQAIQSVKVQTFVDHETIVINDGSPDTDELEQKLETCGAPLVYLKQENSGPSGARNAGLRAARGEFVAFLDADDYWRPDFLREQVSFMRANPDVDLVYSDALIVGDTRLAGRRFMEVVPSNGRVTFRSLLEERCTIVLSSVLARRATIIDAGMFDEAFRLSEDYDLWLRMAKAGASMAYQKKVLLCRRYHSEGLTADAPRLFRSALEVLDKAWRENAMTDGERAALDRRKEKLKAYIRLERGKRDLVSGQFGAAAQAFEDANRFYRSLKLRLVLFWLRVAPNLLQRIYNQTRRMNVESK
jgi:glycosyltransferase involved in cell wall biosynthesis